MLIGLVVNKVHANDTQNVILVAASSHRVHSLLGSKEHANWHRTIVLVSKQIDAESLRNEPLGANSLLSMNNEA